MQLIKSLHWRKIKNALNIHEISFMVIPDAGVMFKTLLSAFDTDGERDNVFQPDTINKKGAILSLKIK